MSNPGRAERRRRQRAAAKGILFTDTGSRERAYVGPSRVAETPGVHQWRLIVTYRVPDRLLDDAVAGVKDSDVLFDHENRLDTFLGCFVCAQQLTATNARSVCPGEPGDQRW